MKSKRSKRERENETPAIVEEPPVRTYFGPEEPTLELECWEEELSPAQLEAYKKADEEYQKVQGKLEAIVKESGGEVVWSGDQCQAYTVSGKNPSLKELSESTRPPAPPKEHVSTRKRGRRDKETRYVEPPSPSPPPSPEPVKKKSKKESKPEKASKISSQTTNVQSVSSGVRPSEASAIGGLATGTGSKSAIVDLTKEDSKNAPDSREVAFNKLQGKTFPSLVVVARPYLRTKDGTGNSDRAALDAKVKSVLMHTPTKFTEWLIQQGLVRSEQLCAIHPGSKLKLGMYSDVSKFPYSGGYVWISECCPTRFVSVFSGSLFEGATHPPSVLLKLIYHWACQTNVQNVVQWVKVDNLYVKGLFTWLRASCTSALHHHMTLMGGNGRRIEVGVISLGTTSHDGLQRQVKVEVLGVIDAEAKLVRLRAVEPLADGERNYKKRFLKILEPLGQWVHPDSIILTDLTVDKGTLIQMGYKTVHQVSTNDSSSKNSNANIMEYLRRIVPRMFQNTLSLLSRQIIQQFLDELVWREWYGNSPGQAFDNIVTHLAEQTRLDAKDILVIRLNKISTNPFKNWKYVSVKPPKAVAPPPVELTKESRGKRKRKLSHSPLPALSPSPPPSPLPTRRGGAAVKETRRRKRVNYIEDDEDDDVALINRRDSKKSKRIEEKKKEPKKKEEKKVEKKPPPKVEKKASKKADKKKDKKKDDLKMTIKKEIMEDQMVDLESYYFGQVDGEYESMAKRQMLVQCTECSAEFDCNTTLQLHLFAHANPDVGGDSVEGEADASQCRYCLQHYRAPEALDGHLLQAHPVDTKSPGLYTYACVICEVRFPTITTLSNHMQKTHIHLELPYTCGVCGYRASSQRTCVDHFYTEHQDSASLQCPYCLKVIKVFADGCDLQSNVEFFLKHIQQHQDKDTSVKCTRCALRFVHLGTLKDHQIRNHVTVLGARPLCTQGHMINKPKNKATPPVKDSTNHKFLEKFDDLSLVIPEGMICRECDTQLEDDKHFLGTTKCSKCPYKTSCWRALLQHSGVCQQTLERGVEPAPLPATMHCICLFSTDDGNALASHLLQCERQTAYPSEEQAKANTVVINDGKSSAESQEIQESTPSQPPANDEAPESLADYPEPPSVLNTQLSLDDLAPPSVLQQDQDQVMELEQLKNEAYEQPLATPQVRHEDLDVAPCMSDVNTESEPPPLSQSQGLDSYMDSTGEFEPLPAEPMPQPEFEPL